MKPLQPPERFHVEAAKGWLELGNLVEAERELQGLRAPNDAHPEALQVQWRILATQKDWKGCLRVARRLRRVDRTHQSGWLHEATSLEELGQTTQARRILVRALKRFGPSSMVAFQMAHLSAHQQPEASDEARYWVGRAVDWANDAETGDWVRLCALRDPLLETIWIDLSAC